MHGVHVGTATIAKKAVFSVMDEIRKAIDNLNNANGLDRVLALLIQASTSVKAAMTPTDSQTPPFEKNFTQLRKMKLSRKLQQILGEKDKISP